MNIAGQYRLHPGCSPGISGGRPVVGGDRLGRLLRGQADKATILLLGQIFSLCAHAHRHTARLALQAAQQQRSVDSTPEATIALQLETARDHLRSMALDWPSRLDNAHRPSALHWLAQCPLPLAPPAQIPTTDQAVHQLAQLGVWLHQQAAQLPFVQLLAQWQTAATALQPSTRTLDVLDTAPQHQAQALQELAHAWGQDSDFSLAPRWRGACAETGVWSRLRHRQRPPLPHSAWSRLMARWQELQELCATPHTALLSSGALVLGAGQAIAWSEMARGLLLHWVQLDHQGRVQDYRVLAPTEWNFHPQGAMAQALARLSPDDADSARLLSAAYDPCVACSIATIPKELSSA